MAHTYTPLYNLKLTEIIITGKNSQRSILFFGLHVLVYISKSFSDMLVAFWQ